MGIFNRSIEEVYADGEKEVDDIRLRIHMHAQEYRMLQEFVSDLGRPMDSNGTYADLGWRQGSLLGLIVQMNLAPEESFKAASPVLEFFLARGWTADGQDENGAWGYRAYKFKKVETARPLFFPSHHDWKPYTLTATVRVWPDANGQLCKKVEAGFEPKYKFECIENA